MGLFRRRQFVFVFMLLVLMVKESQAQFKYNKLVWFDEFNCIGNLVDSSKWSFDFGNGCPDLCGWGNNESQFYTQSRLENARVEDGNLIIEAKKEDYLNSKYTSARLVTKNKADWKYGRFEIKAKIPRGKGIWPAIWMLPTKMKYGIWPHSGEIDIMENVGYWPDSLFGTVHTGAYNGMKGTQKSGSLYMKAMADDFHVFCMEWTENNVAFFVDGKKYHEFNNDKTDTEAWPFDQDFHILLNIAVGGNWGGKYGVDDAIFPQKMLVDYIRVYQ